MCVCCVLLPIPDETQTLLLLSQKVQTMSTQGTCDLQMHTYYSDARPSPEECECAMPH